MLPGHNKNYVFLIFIELMTINSPVPLLFNFFFFSQICMERGPYFSIVVIGIDIG